MKNDKTAKPANKSPKNKPASKSKPAAAVKDAKKSTAKKAGRSVGGAAKAPPAAVAGAVAGAAAGTPVFLANELKPHGNFIVSTGQQIIKLEPGIRWTLITTLQCVTGTVHRLLDGQKPDADDGDTNFNLYFPVINPETGGPSEQVASINSAIDQYNATLDEPGAELPHIERNDGNRIADDVFRLHCEVDPLDLETQKGDLAEMLESDCYTICGYLVLDGFHAGGLYELHPVSTIDRC